MNIPATTDTEHWTLNTHSHLTSAYTEVLFDYSPCDSQDIALLYLFSVNGHYICAVFTQLFILTSKENKQKTFSPLLSPIFA